MPLASALRSSLDPLLTHPRVEPLVSTGLRARLVRPAAGFLGRELTGRRAAVRYTVRGTPTRVVLEHGTPDVLTLDEIFYQRIYEPFEEPARILAGLPRPLRVVDIGANIGLFGAWILSTQPDARITGFEPDPRNIAVHRRTIAANGAEHRWTLVEAAAATAAGELRFQTGRYAVGGPAADDDPSATPVRAVDVLPHLDDCDLLKLDAEGSEWAILGDPRFAASAVRVLNLEYHPELCPEPDAGTAAEHRLRDAGFMVRRYPTQAPEGYGSLWAWR